MKAILQCILLVGFIPHLYGQGTIGMSNIPEGRGKILLNGVPVGAGEATVQLATTDGELIGKSYEILGAGSFSGGSQPLPEHTGTVTLKLAVIYKVMPETIVYSKPFAVALGGSGSPPSPPALLPAFASINLKLDNGSQSSPRFDTWVKINLKEPAVFYRADGIEILDTQDDAILIRFAGSLEVSQSPEGPWSIVD